MFGCGLSDCRIAVHHSGGHHLRRVGCVMGIQVKIAWGCGAGIASLLLGAPPYFAAYIAALSILAIYLLADHD